MRMLFFAARSGDALRVRLSAAGLHPGVPPDPRWSRAAFCREQRQRAGNREALPSHGEPPPEGLASQHCLGSFIFWSVKPSGFRSRVQREEWWFANAVVASVAVCHWVGPKPICARPPLPPRVVRGVARGGNGQAAGHEATLTLGPCPRHLASGTWTPVGSRCSRARERRAMARGERSLCLGSVCAWVLPLAQWWGGPRYGQRVIACIPARTQTHCFRCAPPRERQTISLLQVTQQFSPR